jgi:hypothetical protein
VIDVPVWLIVLIGVACIGFWLKAFDFGAPARTRWTCFVFAVILLAIECAGIVGNTSGFTY